MGRFWKRGLTINIVGAVVLLAIALAVGLSYSGTSGKHISAKPTAPSVGVGNPVNCWPVQLDPNKGDKVLSDGIPAEYQDTAPHAMQYLLTVAKSDPRALQAMWNVSPAGEKSPVSDWHLLVYKNCYSEEGVTLWRQLAVQNQVATLAISQAPATGCNTYVTPGGNAACRVETINGNRTAVEVAYSSGQTMWVMFRCGNPVTKAPPSPPVTPTVPKSPPTTSPPTTKPTCTSGKCVPATTTPPPPVTAHPDTTTTTTCPQDQGCSGWGATSTTTPPTTTAPAPAPPTTDSPPGTAAPPSTV